jgi:sulfoquinovosidase
MLRRRGMGSALACAVLALAPAAAGAATTRVEAGPLVVEVDEAPFDLRVLDRADGDVLRLSPTGPDGRGGLGAGVDARRPVADNSVFGYEVSAEGRGPWTAATRVAGARREGAAAVLELATDGAAPGVGRLTLRVEPVADGVARLTLRAPAPATTTGLALRSGGAAERLLGFGSRSNAVDQRGQTVFSWAEEGPFSSGRAEALLRPLIPAFTFPTGPTATNLPIPWAVSTRGLGVLVESTERSTFHLGEVARGAWRVSLEAAELRLVVVAGPRPADVVRRYSALAGRQPRPAGWLLGPWVQFRGDWDREFVARDVPTSVAQTYTHYLPCGEGRDGAAERRRVRRAHDLGMKITTYFNPHVCTSYAAVYDEAARKGLFVKNPAGEPYLLTNPFTDDQLISTIDFSHPEGRRLFGRLLDEALGHGYDGWMEDFGEYVPHEGRLHDGTTGYTAHNRYPVDYHCASDAHTRPKRGADLAVFIRSGGHGVQRCARAVWGGDPTEDWSCADGLCAAVHQLLNVGCRAWPSRGRTSAASTRWPTAARTTSSTAAGCRSAS